VPLHVQVNELVQIVSNAGGIKHSIDAEAGGRRRKSSQKQTARAAQPSGKESKGKKRAEPEAGDLVVTFAEPGPLGLAFRSQGQTLEQISAPTVVEIQAAGSAALMKDCPVEVGMRLKKIQGRSCEHDPFATTLEHIREAGRPLTLTFEHPDTANKKRRADADSFDSSVENPADLVLQMMIDAAANSDAAEESSSPVTAVGSARSKKSTAADCVDAGLTPTTSTVLCQFVGGRPMGVILSTTSADPRTVAGVRAESQAGLAPELNSYFSSTGAKIPIGSSTVADCPLLVPRPGIVVKLSQVDGQNLRGVADADAIHAVTKASLQAPGRAVAVEFDVTDHHHGGGGGGGGGGEVSGGEVKKKAESKKSRRSWHPLSEADARRVDLFETAISAQTVIVVLLYVSFGTAGYSLFGR
jgi:hypothetical protein